MQLSDTEQFQRNLDWIINILKTQDSLIVDAFKRGAKKLIETNFFRNVFIAAMNNLAEHDIETFDWALYNFDLHFFMKIKREVVYDVGQYLIKHGLIPGIDFSSTTMGDLIVNQKAIDILLRNPYTYHSLLFKEILYLLT